MTADPENEAGPESKVSLRHRLEYVLYLTVRAVARIVGDRGLDAFGSFVAWSASRLVKRRTELATRNLAMVWPDMEAEARERIVRACWKHYATESIRYVRDSGIPFETIAKRFAVGGRENMEHALSFDKGVLLLSAHFGSWENALSLLSGFGRKVVVVGRVLDNPLLHRRLYEGRTRSGFELLDRRAAARDLLRALQQKAIVVLLVDQAVREREGAIVPFLGHDAWTTTSPARLAAKYRCPILSVFTYPATAEEGPRVEFEPVVETEGLDDVGVMKLVNEQIGGHIAAEPHLWLWFHDRWKGV
jgi:KDO2-lipid IV(A) lauroyltransferase